MFLSFCEGLNCDRNLIRMKEWDISQLRSWRLGAKYLILKHSMHISRIMLHIITNRNQYLLSCHSDPHPDIG